jgi:hypothetical protein
MRRKVSSLSPGIGVKSRQLFKLGITEPSSSPPNNNQTTDFAFGQLNVVAADGFNGDVRFSMFFLTFE